MQYEKATAPRNRNRRNGPRGSARASRDLIRHPDRAGLSSPGSGVRGAAGLCASRLRGTAGVRGPEADLPAGSGRAGTGLLCPAAGRLLRTPQPRLEASAPALWALRALSSSLNDQTWGTQRRGTRCQSRRNVESSADRKRSALLFVRTFSAQRPEADCNWPVTLSLFSGQKGYAGTRNQWRAAYTP